jgi:hypothetical protein
MVNPELVNWVRNELAKGQTEVNLTNILIKRNYSDEEIKATFKSINNTSNESKQLEKTSKTPFSVAVTILAGISFFMLLLVFLVITIVSFTSQTIMGYFLIILIGLGMGYFIYHIRKKINGEEGLGAILGVFAPTLSIILIILQLTLEQKLAAQLSAFKGGSGGFAGMANIISSGMDPIVTATIFYIFCNLFVIISIMKSKKYAVFLWYIIAPIILFVTWVAINLILSSIFIMSQGFF